MPDGARRWEGVPLAIGSRSPCFVSVAGGRLSDSSTIELWIHNHLLMVGDSIPQSCWWLVYGTFSADSGYRLHVPPNPIVRRPLLGEPSSEDWRSTTRAPSFPRRGAIVRNDSIFEYAAQPDSASSWNAGNVRGRPRIPPGSACLPPTSPDPLIRSTWRTGQ